MSQVTTLGIGGPAKEFLIARTEEELTNTIKSAKKDGKAFLVIGGGSNLLVSDEGVDELIIKNKVAGISQDGNTVIIKSGTSLQELVDFTISYGLSGLQNMTGIPGTVGGAIYGNAGAYGQTISDHLVSVKVISPQVIASEDRDFVVSQSEAILRNKKSDRAKQSKGVATLTKDQCDFSYRESGFKKNGYIILEATFHLSSEDPEKLKQEAEETLSKRLVRYPPGLKCPGSFFKNIPAEKLPPQILKNIPEEKIPFGKVNAGYLLEQVGAKGQRVGDIEVSQVHANLFVNLGEGTASEFHKLASRLAKAVKEKFDITLEPEVQLINLPPLN